MPTPERRPTLSLLLLLACWCAVSDGATAQEQSPQDSPARPAAARRVEANHDVHLYMLVET